MKSLHIVTSWRSCRSPSMRREWIEMIANHLQITIFQQSPSMRREWIEMNDFKSYSIDELSPSMRREWIEMMIQH